MSRHLCIALALLLAACCPCRNTSTSAESITRDSVYITHHDTLRIVERDTMRLAQLEQWHERVMARGESTLENIYCTTTAKVDDDGFLWHTLDTRDSALLPVQVITRDRVMRDTVYRWRDRVTSRTKVVEKRVKTTPWWVKPLCVISAALAAVVIWQNRKRIMTIIRLWRI